MLLVLQGDVIDSCMELRQGYCLVWITELAQGALVWCEHGCSLARMALGWVGVALAYGTTQRAGAAPGVTAWINFLLDRALAPGGRGRLRHRTAQGGGSSQEEIESNETTH
jgi:hypothetical protein